MVIGAARATLARAMVWNARDSKNKLRAWWAAAATLLVIGLSSCGSDGQDAVVVRVGDNAITKATVDRWTSVVRGGGTLMGFRGEQREGTPKQQALGLLIFSDWVIGEAVRLGVPVPEKAVDDALAERTQGGGAAEFHKRLATGQTVAGIERELTLELTLEAIRQEVTRRASQITKSEVVAFYRRNPGLFGVLETRVVDIIENLPSAAAATALVRRVGTGRHFAEMAYHKSIQLTPGVLQGPAIKKEVDHAIFAARPGMVSRPMRFNEGWTVFVVRKITPAQPEPLAKVYQDVVASLTEQRKREIAGALEDEYARRWMARTSCRRGYVVPGCAQYHGSPEMPKDLFVGG